jgi:ribosomal protein S18 acetylase RimI-like enzyme
MTTQESVTIRTADAAEVSAVRNILDGAALEIENRDLAAAIERDDVLVAVAGANPERLLGALVLIECEISAIAVRRLRRDQGIGTALVREALQRNGTLTAEFDPVVRAFWESLADEIRTGGEDRLHARIAQ